MIHRISLLLVCLITALSAQAQPNLDSLKRVWNDPVQADTARLQAMMSIVWNGYLRTQPDSAFEYAQQAYDLAQQKGQKPYMSLALNAMGASRGFIGNFEQALDYYEQSLKINEEIGEQRGVAVILINCGNLYAQIGKYSQGLDYFQRGLQISEEIGYKEGAATCLMNMGNVYRDQGDYPQALDYLQQGLKAKEELGDQMGIVLSLQGIGLIYAELADYEQGHEYLARSLKISEEIGDKRGIAYSLNDIGTLFNEQGNYSQGLDHFQRALKMHEEIQNPQGIASSLTNIGLTYYEQGEYSQALDYHQRSLKISEEFGDQEGIGLSLTNMGLVHNQLNNPAKAIVSCQQALQVTEAIGAAFEQKTACDCLYEAYKATGNYRQALAYHEQGTVLNDSLYNEENTKKLTRLEMQYEFDKQEAETRAEQAETELAYQAQIALRNYLVLGSLALLGIGVIGFLFFRYRQQQQARRRELALQQERERQAQLAELDQLKTTFFTNVSHEFRTPLTVMLGMAEQLPANIDQARSLIHRNGQRLLRLINQLLDLARLESQDLSLNLVQGDIMAYLRYVAESFYTLAQQREIDLQVSAEPGILVMDYDPEKLQDILYNLLSNALKYTPSGGEVRLAMRQAEERLQVEVADTGPGIPEKELPLVFNRFYQGSSTAQEGSSGIGLALVQALLERMGGEITVASEPGAGATFTAWLPIQRAAETTLAVPVAVETSEAVAAPSSEVVLPEDPDQPQVLLIEDNPDVIAYLSAILGSQYNLLTATDGNSGLALAQERIPDLVVCDVMMPGKDGFAVTEALKTDTRTSHIPVILLTAKATQADKLEGLSHGADAYLTKPFDRAELMLRIDKLLALRAELQARYRAIPAVAPVEVEDSKPPKPPTLDELFLEKIRQTVAENLTNPKLSVHDLADVVHLSHSQVFRKLKALTGQNPTLYIRTARLHHAKELLETTSLTISEVAYEAGFNDPNYFSRTFAKEFGQRPSVLREG